MISINFSKFSTKLIFNYLIVFLFFLILVLFFYFKNTSALLVKEVLLSNNYSLHQMTSNINTQLKEVNSISYYLMVSPKIQEISTKNNTLNTTMSINTVDWLKEDKEIRTIIANVIFTSDTIKHVYIYSKSGRIYESGLTSPEPVNTNYDTLLAKCLSQNRNFNSGRLYWFYNQETRHLSAFKLIKSLYSQEGIGIMEIRPRDNFIKDIINDPGLNQSYNIVLLDENNNIIFQKNKDTINYKQLFAKRKQNSEESFNIRLNNRVLYVLSDQIEDVNWSLIMTISTKEINRNIIQSTNFILIIGILVAFAFIVISVIISYDISNPIRKLREEMKKVEAGNLELQITDLGKDEIGDLGRSFNNMIKQLKKLIDEVYVQKLINKESELEALQAQINPHFLYNTLESINCIAEIKGVKEIGKMVQTLAQLLRNCISNKNDLITVEKELKNIEGYLYLQNIRFGGKIKTEIFCDEADKQLKIPKLILQPIIENAILHGLEKKIGNGLLKLEIVRDNHSLMIIVTDDGIGFEQNEVEFKESGLGIKNVNKRIQILYGEDYGLAVESEKGKGTSVKITLPIMM